MTDEDPQIDWEAMRIAMINFAELVWSYNAALVAAGFEPEEAIMLATAYQNELVRKMV